MTIIPAIENVLAETNITHGSLVEGTPWLNRNFSDEQKVFIKLTQPHVLKERFAEEIRQAMAAESTFGKHDRIRAPQALKGFPLRFGEELLSLWEYIPPSPKLSYSASIDIRLEIINLLKAHTAKRIAIGGIETFSEYLEHYDEVLNRAQPGFVKDQFSHYLDLVSKIEIRDPIWAHGDLHNGNFIVNEGIIYLFDWEETCLGPLELDLAKLLYSSYVHAVREGEDLTKAKDLLWEKINESFPSASFKIIEAIFALELFGGAAWAGPRDTDALSEVRKVLIDKLFS